METANRAAIGRVLWFTNVPLAGARDAFGLRAGHSGSWMEALAQLLSRVEGVDLHVAASGQGPARSVRVGEITHHSLPLGSSRFSIEPSKAVLGPVAELLRALRPDIVHVHGTESVHGAIALSVFGAERTLISIQGLLSKVVSRYYGGLALSSILGMTRPAEIVLGSGLIEGKRRMQAAAEREVRTLRRGRHVAGRTLWDRGFLRAVNPKAEYHECHEAMRPEIFAGRWVEGSFVPHSIFVTNVGYPLKGFHVLIDAVRILLRSFPSVQIRYCGSDIEKAKQLSGYSHYLSRQIASAGLSRHVVPLGVLGAVEIARELERCNVFVLPSFAENSPNSLCEAMVIGTPSVASFVGGVGSLVEDRRSAILVPPGEPEALAEAIRSVFESAELRRALSTGSRTVALARHDPDAVRDAYLRAYRSMGA
jgi:glycosyltransferase involved in cell wall biosynthesis